MISSTYGCIGNTGLRICENSFINLNQITFQKNLVRFLPTQQVGSDLLFLSDMMPTSKKIDSQSKRKQRISKVAPTDGAEDPFTRINSAIGKLTKDMQTTFELKEQRD